MKSIFGKSLADKGYISEKLQKILFIDSVHLITSIINNMKNSLMTVSAKILLRKSVIETVNDELKNICQAEHSIHSSSTNFVSNIITGLIAYCFLPKKPYIKFQNNRNNNQLALFFNKFIIWLHRLKFIGFFANRIKLAPKYLIQKQK